MSSLEHNIKTSVEVAGEQDKPSVSRGLISWIQSATECVVSALNFLFNINFVSGLDKSLILKLRI